jgi:ribosomal protein L31
MLSGIFLHFCQHCHPFFTGNAPRYLQPHLSIRNISRSRSGWKTR